MTRTRGTAYVVQNEEGLFLKGKSAWSKTWTEDLGKARLYTGKGYAKTSMSQCGRYAQRDTSVMTIREVEVILK